MREEQNIYVIIVTYNAMRWIDHCIGSLRRSTIPLHTIVIDNCSKDETVEYIQARFPEVTVLPQAENLGFGQGNNLGISYAMQQGASHVLLLNQDAWIEADMVEELLRYDDGNSLLSPIHMTGEGDRLDKNFKKHALIRAERFEQLIDDWAVGRTDKYATYEINAACWLLPKKIIHEIGGFNPMFFHYAEDINYLHRLHYHKKGVYFVPKAKAYHDRANIAEKPLTEQYMYQQMLLRELDINYSTCHATCRKWRWITGMIHTSWQKRHFPYILLLCRAWKRVLTKKAAIKANRRQETETGNHWIRL